MDEKTRKLMRDFSLTGGVRRSRIEEPLVTGISISEAALAIEQKGGFTRWLNGWLADNFNKNLDAYDAHIDSVYNQTRIGGSQLHHLLDGQHTIWGAFKAVRDVSQDDTWLKELAEAGEHVLRDTASISGVNPFFGLSPERFNQVAHLVQRVGISKTYLADALTINGAELIGGGIALTAAVIMGKRRTPKGCLDLEVHTSFPPSRRRIPCCCPLRPVASSTQPTSPKIALPSSGKADMGRLYLGARC